MAREFAPGIPAGRIIKTVPKVSPKADNPEWDVSLSMHPAAVRGDHYDLRLVDPKGKAHSWAMSKIPDPGQSTYAAQQPTHSKEYALRSKPWKIPPGYGATRPGKQVEPVYVQKAEIVQAGNDKVRFLRHHGQETDEFVLRKVREEAGKPLWALHNATKNRYTREGQKLPSSKPKYKEIRPEQVSFSDIGEVMTPKLDGAHVLVDMKGPGAPMRVYSYRPTERKTGVIEHTFKFPDFQKRTTSPATKNTLVRAELWASKDGKAIPAEQLGGLLNAGVLRSRKMQNERGVQLRLTGIDVIKHKGRNYTNKDFDQKLKALREITRGTKGMVETPPVARTEEEKRRLMSDIERGKLPETKEGVVLHRIDGVSPPTKVKFKPQHDVYVREVFDKPRGAARGHAGGFAYSMTPDGPIVGRVGTGFNHSMRKDMLDNPDKYVGRVAKVKSQGPFRSGALRAPSFDEWHIDKTPPELMKESQAYHYGPSDVDLTVEGMKTPATLGSAAAEKYRIRTADALGKPASKVTRADVIQWLEQSRGPGGSRMGSILHQPIGASATPEQQAYARRRQLYEIDYDRALREGAIEGAHVVEESPRSKRSVEAGKLLAELGAAKGYDPGDRKLLFQGSPHGFITIKGGTLPGKYLKKQGAGELYHGSPYRLDKLEPKNIHGDPRVPAAVFGTPSRPFALAYSGDKWGDRDLEQSMKYDEEDNPTEMSLREMRPGALKDIYGGKKGYLYTLPGEGFELPPRQGAKWEQINRAAVTPSETEEIADVMEALKGDPVVKMHPYNPKDPQVRVAIQRSIKRMGEMKPEDAKGYKKWRLEKAPPEIAKMFEEEMLRKESQDATLKALKEYKEQALEEITPDRAVQIAKLVNKPTRTGTAAGIGFELAKEHLDEVVPGSVEKQIEKARREAMGTAQKGLKQTAGFVKGLAE